MLANTQPSSEPVELVRLDCPRTGDTIQIGYGVDIESYVAFGYADADTIEVDLDTAAALQLHWKVAIRSAERVDPTLWSTTDLPTEVAVLACPRTDDTVQIGYGANGTDRFVTIGHVLEDPIEFTPPEARHAMAHFLKAMEAAQDLRPPIS